MNDWMIELIGVYFIIIWLHLVVYIQVNADTLTAESCDTITAKNVAIIHGTDREGRPVVSVIVGNHDKVS